MTGLLIKLCGLNSPALVDHAAALGADMAGFVHFPASPRHVAMDRLGSLIAHSRGRIASVVLLVDPDDALFDAVAALGPDHIQLHGRETPRRVGSLAGRGIPLIKALPVARAEDLAAVPDYASAARHLILDAKPPQDADRPGGLGQPFDWALLDALGPGVPYMLSGGLDPDNVPGAIERARRGSTLAGLDVSSGIEASRGVKDRALMRAFVTRARAAEIEKES